MQFQESDVEEESTDEAESQPHLDSIQKEQVCPELESHGQTLSDTSKTALKKVKISARKVKASQCTKDLKKDYLTSNQIQAIHKYFQRLIENRCVPKKADCEDFLRKESLLDGKSWLKIKCTVRNEIERKKRLVKKLQH